MFFRMPAKMLLPLLLWSIHAIAYAQNPATPATAMLCTPASVPTITRVEGVTELVGDMILSCTGGVPTPLGAAIPKSNIQVFLNTNITSRILSAAGLSEALLLIDEPFPSLRPCRPR